MSQFCSQGKMPASRLQTVFATTHSDLFKKADGVGRYHGFKMLSSDFVKLNRSALLLYSSKG
jgi:hypothetical protein